MQQWAVEVLAKQEGIETGIEEGIKALIIDNMEENIPNERIIKKLIRHFSLTKEKSEEYYTKYSMNK